MAKRILHVLRQPHGVVIQYNFVFGASRMTHWSSNDEYSYSSVREMWCVAFFGLSSSCHGIFVVSTVLEYETGRSNNAVSAIRVEQCASLGYIPLILGSASNIFYGRTWNNRCINIVLKWLIYGHSTFILGRSSNSYVVKINKFWSSCRVVRFIA